MPNLIRPKVTEVVTTKDGEIVVHISIDLNLNLTTDGIVKGLGVESTVAPQSPQPPKEEDTTWAIPDFKMGGFGGNLKFGEEKE